MTTTMALAAISSVGLEMTSLDTMPVTRMATKPAWKAGWVQSVTKPYADRAAVPSMALASSRVTAGASMVGRACTAISASRTQGVSMAPAMNPGSASVRPTGVDSSVTKI